MRRSAGGQELRILGRRGRRAVGLVALLAAAGACLATVATSSADEGPRAPVLTIRPVVPPAGGFAVAADRMDEALAGLVGEVSSEPVRHADRRQQVLVERAAGGVRRAVQTGSVRVGQAGLLVEVAVRRAPDRPCATPVCVDVVDHPGSSTTPRSVEVVVDAEGVEVAVRAWDGPGLDATSPLAEPPLTTRQLVDLAADDLWRR